MLRVGLSRFSPLETKARGFLSPGGTQIIQVLDHFTLKQSWWLGILHFKKPPSCSPKPQACSQICGCCSWSCANPAKLTEWLMMEWKNAIHGLRSKYIRTILMKNALKDGKRFLCLSRTSLAACRYGRALTITVLEPDYSQERTLSPCPVVVHAPFMHVQHYWVPTDAGFHVQNDQGCWSIEFPTSSTSIPNHPQTCWGVAKLCIHRAPHILCHGRAGCLDTRLAGSVNKSAAKQGDAPNHSSPKDIHYNQESVILVVLGVTNQYSFDRPATSIEIRWFLQIPPWPLVIPVTCKIKGVSTEFRWNTFWWKWYQPIHLHFPNLFMKIKAILFPPLKTRLSTDPVRCRLCHQHSQCVCNAAICGNAFSIWSSNHQALSHANHRHCRWTWTNMTPGPPKDAETVDSDFPTSAGTDSRNRIKTCRGESSAPPGYWIPGVGKVTKIKECFS